MINKNKFKVEIYADGASIDEFISLNKLEFIKGFTTNPTLMKNKIENYQEFAQNLTNSIADKPISFEVFADDLNEMYAQAKKINLIAKNIFIKIPITNTLGESTNDLVNRLLKEKIKVNVTAIFLVEQCMDIIKNHKNNTPLILSYFAGRVADTGVDPIPNLIRLLDQLK